MSDVEQYEVSFQTDENIKREIKNVNTFLKWHQKYSTYEYLEVHILSLQAALEVLSTKEEPPPSDPFFKGSLAIISYHSQSLAISIAHHT